MNGSGGRYVISGGAALAGLTAAVIDLAGLVGASPFWSVLELVCGTAAGLGLAALWMRSGYSRTEKTLAVFLLAVHIFTVWPWIPFAAGLAVREKARNVPDRRWFGRAWAVLVLLAATVGGTGMIYRGLFPIELPLPVWVVPAGAAAVIAVPWIAARYGMALSRREAAGVLCRVLAASALVLAAAMIVKLRVWRPEPWYVYAVTAAVLAGSAVGAFRLRIPAAVRGPVRAPLFCMAVLLAGWIAMDNYLDTRYYFLRRWQPVVFRKTLETAMPLVEACREYRVRFGTWPDAPEKLMPLLPPKTRLGSLAATGCHADENGDFLLVMQRGFMRPVFARRFRPDGTEAWEILSPNHPLLPPGAKRWKHPFPHTD